MPMPVSSRGFYTTEVGTCVSQISELNAAFRVLSFNILAERYTSSDKYPDCDPISLPEAYRSPLLAREILVGQPDVIALQEMSVAMYTAENMLGAALRREGYIGSHAVITGPLGRDLNAHVGGESDVRGDVEGVAIFFKASRFETIPGYPAKRLCLNEHPAMDPALTPAERKKILISSHNVALSCPLRCLTTHRCYLFVTLHAFWDTSKAEVQLYQLDQMLQNVHTIYSALLAQEGAANVTLILLGDFNCELGFPAMSYLMKGCLDLSTHRIDPLSVWSRAEGEAVSPSTSPMRPTSALGGRSPFAPIVTQTLGRRAAQKVELRQPFRFDSAYAEYFKQQGHLGHITAVNPSQGYVGSVIDHIFTERRHMSVLECGVLASKRSAQGELIPNTAYPSDHYPVMATLVPLGVLEGLAAGASTIAVPNVSALATALKAISDGNGAEGFQQNEDDATPAWFLTAEETLRSGAYE